MKRKWFDNAKSQVPEEIKLIEKGIDDMAGTVAGGKAAAQTNKQKYGADFYSKIGAKGGAKGRTGGFAARVECTNKTCDYRNGQSYHYIAECAGSRGGTISRRGKPDGKAS